LQIINKLDKSG